VRVLPVGDQRRIDLPSRGEGRDPSRRRPRARAGTNARRGRCARWCGETDPSRRARVASRRAPAFLPRTRCGRARSPPPRSLRRRLRRGQHGCGRRRTHACGHGSRGLTSRDAPPVCDRTRRKEAVAAELRLRGSDDERAAEINA
jgi:hypothetical protein